MSSFVCDKCQDVGFISDDLKCECNITANCKSDYQRYDGPVHSFFGLSYCSYFCVPRLALQGMPIWWQKLFVWLVKMLPESLPTYSCQRRNKKGRFINDPWANYRRGNINELLVKEKQCPKGLDGQTIHAFSMESEFCLCGFVQLGSALEENKVIYAVDDIKVDL